MPNINEDKLFKEIAEHLEYFDIERYLDSRNIEYQSEGKNVKHGWIGTRCLWCDDASNHLGINLESKSINCFRCPAKGTAIKLILRIDRCSLKTVLETVKKYTNIRHYTREKRHDTEHLPQRKTSVALPEMSKKELYPVHRRYLEKRGFEPEFIFNKYNLHCNGPVGIYKLRLIIPFHYKNRLVTFTSRDVTGKSNLAYKHHPESDSILSTKETIYNIDKIIIWCTV